MTAKLITAFVLLLASAAACYGDIYTWMDGRGVAHYTNSIHEIPARYLKKARVLDVATGKLGGLATAQPAQKGAGAPASQAVPGAQLPAAGTAAAAATPTGAPAPAASSTPAEGPAAMAPPAMPTQRTFKLPPPSAEAQRKLNRIRARSHGEGSQEE